MFPNHITSPKFGGGGVRKVQPKLQGFHVFFIFIFEYLKIGIGMGCWLSALVFRFHNCEKLMLNQFVQGFSFLIFLLEKCI